MQTTGGASSSTDPASVPAAANSATQLDDLDRLLQVLLRQSFLQPREDVTDLAYKACARLLQLRQALTRESDVPTMVNTAPDGGHLMVKPLLLRQLLSQQEGMQTPRLRRTLQQLGEFLGHARLVIDSLGRSPPPEQWHEALAGIKDAEGTLDALHLAVEEGGVAAIQEALQALLSAVDRTTVYLDHALLDASQTNGVDHPGKRRKGPDPYVHLEPQRHRDLRHPPELPAAPADHAGHDLRHRQEGTLPKAADHLRPPPALPAPPPDLEGHDHPDRDGHQQRRTAGTGCHPLSNSTGTTNT